MKGDKIVSGLSLVSDMRDTAFRIAVFVSAGKWPFTSIVKNGNLYDHLVSWES